MKRFIFNKNRKEDEIMCQYSNKSPVIIDADPGVDDSVSIIWLIANGSFNIKALTVTNGNVGLDKCVLNALRVLEVCKRTDIPVYAGAYRPLVRPSVDAAWVHGKDGLGDAEFPLPKMKPAQGYAPAEMVRIAKESPEPITILALGPLTNVALAILQDRTLKDHVKEILFMGGAVLVPGNESPGASFNAAVDPEAAKVVYDSGIPVVQLGLDVCDKIDRTYEDLDRVQAIGTEVTDFITKLLAQRRKGCKRYIRDRNGNLIGEAKNSSLFPDRVGAIALNDMTTTAYLVNPNWFKTIEARMDVETSGLCPGQTFVDFRGYWAKEPNGYFAYDLDIQAPTEQWIKDLEKFNP